MGGRRTDRTDADGERASRFSDALGRLERSGATVLVVGEVGPAARAAVTGRLLGAGSPYRTQVLALLDHPRKDPRRFVADTVDIGAETFRLLAPDARAAVAADVEPSTPDERVGDRHGVGDTPAAVANGIEAAVAAVHPPSTEWPVDLRVGVVSLAPLFDLSGADPVADLVATVGATVRPHHGTAHFHLPAAPEDRRRTALVDRGVLDIVVELRASPDTAGLEERWLLPQADERSDWLAL